MSMNLMGDERRDHMVRRRSEGATLAQIGRELGVSRQYVFQEINRTRPWRPPGQRGGELQAVLREAVRLLRLTTTLSHIQMAELLGVSKGAIQEATRRLLLEGSIPLRAPGRRPPADDKTLRKLRPTLRKEFPQLFRRRQRDARP